MDAGPDDLLVPLDALRSACRLLLESAGLGPETAELVADSLTDAEARGIRSHGVCRLPIYAHRVRGGMIDAAATPTIVRESPGALLVDAHNAIGHVGARAGIDLAVDRARSQQSVCVVGVRNSNHCGTLAYFLRRATRAGLVGLAASNAPPTMAYHGGRTRAVGTNPLAVGIPRDGSPIMLDMATSATARGKIILADELGETIPDGWAVDVDGRPTTDPKRALAGAVLPFAGAKGSGLALVLDLLCGGLMAGVTGDEVGDMYDDWTRPQRVSHLFVALDPDAFVGRARFAAHVAAFADRVHGLPAADGFGGVLLPGEVEERARRAAERDGVRIAPAVAGDLRGVAAELGTVAALEAALAGAGGRPARVSQPPAPPAR